MINRRTFLFAVPAVIAVPGATLAFAQEKEPPETASVETPPVQFDVLQVQDPYQGALVSPAELNPDMRYIGSEVRIVNESDLPLTVAISNIRLRDANGIEYPSGPAYGEDVRLLNRTLNGGEEARGWVWHTVPAEAEIVQMVFIPSVLELRIPADELPVVEGSPAASPEPDA